MNYVKYMQEEKAAIIRGLDQIKAYVDETLRPMMLYAPCVNVKYEDTMFGFDDKNTWFQVGNHRMYFNREAEASVYSATYARTLLLNWMEYKTRLNSELARQSAEHTALMNFHV